MSGLARHYDLCFGIGGTDVCTRILRRAGLQNLAYPFDWVRSEDPLACARLIATGFANFLNREDLVYLYRNPMSGGLGVFDNRRTGIAFPCDFPDQSVDAAVFGAVLAKYERRIRRLLDALGRVKSALMVCVLLPGVRECDPRALEEVRRTVQKAFPSLGLDLLVFRCRKGVERADATLRPVGERVFEFAFDYGLTAYTFREPELLKALQSFGISAADLRTREEVEAFASRQRAQRRQGRYRRLGAKTRADYLWRRFFVRPVRMAWAAVRRKRYGHVLSLGVNCEVAFRFVRRWGAIDPSLFNWGVTGDLAELVGMLRNLDRIGSGAFELTEGRLWECAVTRFRLHGRMNLLKFVPLPPQEDLDADLEDLRGRVRHLKEKFRRQPADERRTLLVRRLSDNDMADPALGDKLCRLRDEIRRLGGRNCEILVVVTRGNRRRVPRTPGIRVRTVERFNPKSCAVSLEHGDNLGWDVLFSEFVPQEVAVKKHAYKFD